MGLGLAICQRLVRYGRGDISIRNQTAPDGLSGTVVTIHFLHEHGAGMATIHLLDDDTAVTNACAFLLESLGYDVKCWTQGRIFGAGQSVSGRSRITGYANAGTGWAGRS